MGLWSSQPPLKLGGSFSGRFSGPFRLWIEVKFGLVAFCVSGKVGFVC